MKPLLFSQIYKDRFITFGGLISSSIVARELKKASSVCHDLSFESLKPFFSGKGKEPQIQQHLEKWLVDDLKRYGLKFKPYDFKRDILISEPQKIIIEIKHNHYETPEPLDDLKGSPAPLSAVQQLFKYLLTSEPDIGILTDGMSFRFYYSTLKKPQLLKLPIKKLINKLVNFSFEPYLEFSINDIVAAKSKLHYDFFLRLLLQPNYLIKLVAETLEEKVKTTEKAFSELGVYLKEAIDDNYNDFSSIVIFTATIGAIRVLEDHGVFEIHPETHRGKGYKEVSLQGRAFNETLLRQNISAFLNGNFLRIEGHDFGVVLDYDGNTKLDVKDIIEKLLTSSKNKKILKNIYQIIVEADCSDLDWNFWSILYQLNANKEDKNARFGKYYTHPEIIANIVEWFVHREQRSTQDLKNLPIYDPCVGSGNMLRTFLSFAQRLEPSSFSPVEAAWNLVKNKLWGSDIDLCALWICKLSLSTALASRYNPMPVPRIFQMDVFDNDGWNCITKGQNQKFSIVSNPPWKRPKFQLNYAFQDFFGLSKLPKVGTDLYKPYEEFKKIVTFGKRSTAQYYKDWDLLLTGSGSLPIDQKEHFQDYDTKFNDWLIKYKFKIGFKAKLNLKNVLIFFREQRDDVFEQKKKFSESFSSSIGDTPDIVLKDKSCAAMFFSRMVRGIANGSKFAIVQPDSFFVGDSEERRLHLNVIERYFCFSKNRIPGTQKPLFSEVHTGMKFGVVLGTKGVKNNNIKAVIFKTDLTESEFHKRKRTEIDKIEVAEFVVDKRIYKRQNFGMLPIFDTEQAHSSLVAWLRKNKPCIGKLRWRVGIDQSSSRNWTSGKHFLLASSKSLQPEIKSYIFSFMNKNKHRSKYERRNLGPETIASQQIQSVRVFIADVNRNAPLRHSCLVCGLIRIGQAVFNNILWCAPKKPKKILSKIASTKFEKALYIISKSNHINALALNWLGFKS